MDQSPISAIASGIIGSVVSATIAILLLSATITVIMKHWKRWKGDMRTYSLTRLAESSGQSETEVSDNTKHGSQQNINKEQQYKSEHELQPILEAGPTTISRLDHRERVRAR